MKESFHWGIMNQTHNKFPISLWERLMPQCKMTLNKLMSDHLIPKYNVLMNFKGNLIITTPH